MTSETNNGHMRLPNRLVNKAKKGDKEALNRFCNWSLPLVKRILNKAGAQKEILEDIAQESMLRILQGLPGLKHNKAIVSYIFQCARNAWRDYLESKYKHNKVQQLSLDDFNRVYLADNEPQKQLALELLVADSLSRMPMALRELYFLWKVQGNTTQKIAALMGVSEYIVTKSKADLKRRLYRDIFSDFGDEWG